MKNILKIFLIAFVLLFAINSVFAGVIVVAGRQNPILRTLVANDIKVKRADGLEEALKLAAFGDGLLVLEPGNNQAGTNACRVSRGTLIAAVRNKKLKVYIQYPWYLTEKLPAKGNITLERGVVVTSSIPGVDSLGILSVNDHPFFEYDNEHGVLASIAKVAGFDRAEYGLKGTRAYPLLFVEKGILVSSVDISDWMIARFGPADYWKDLWHYIFNYVGVGKKMHWNTDTGVRPGFAANALLTRTDYRNAIKKGAAWYINSKLLVAGDWRLLVDRFTHKNGEGVVFPGVADSMPAGDGQWGILEGHASHINRDGSQPVRWWVRADCQAETAFALSTAAKALGHSYYDTIARNLLHFLYRTSNLRQGERNDPASPSFGLIGWATTDPDAYYGDDNARVLLGTIGASANLATEEWFRYITEGILGNFRTAGQNGFRGPWFRDASMQKTGWKALSDRNIENVHPHYESWLWALYLWLYDKTGYEPLKYKAKTAITLTMKKFPEWKWTNGIQQEYARMLLPLAWLVRVEDDPVHRNWLKLVALTLLRDLDSSGAIKERLGLKGLGRYDKIRSNEEYGTKEAPLISDYGDPVSDLLYTLNFCSFGLNEAFAATRDSTYKQALEKMDAFFVRVQVNAPTHKDLDGAWFRAFDFGRWEYWASNADSGWGPWGTQTGWTQSWILNALARRLDRKNFWDQTRELFNSNDFRKSFTGSLNTMLEQKIN